MSDLCKVVMPGFNPDALEGFVIEAGPNTIPTSKIRIYVAPDRALEALEVAFGGKPLMYRNPAGHRSRFSYNPYGLGPIDSIEGFFTAGAENTGPPQDIAPLHGTFSQTAVLPDSIKRTDPGGISGIINFQKLVRGPNLVVARTVNPVEGKYAFTVEDKITAPVASDFMWLYHPNFNVEEGTTFLSSESRVLARDRISYVDSENYRMFTGVGKGVCRFPPEPENDVEIRKENFEKCYIMEVSPSKDGFVYAMLISPDGTSASYINYDPNDYMHNQQAFQLWKNPRDGVAGLEMGSPFLGWSHAAENGLLCHLSEGESHTYRIEVGFLRTKSEVDKMKGNIEQALQPTILLRDEKNDISPAMYLNK